MLLAHWIISRVTTVLNAQRILYPYTTKVARYLGMSTCRKLEALSLPASSVSDLPLDSLISLAANLKCPTESRQTVSCGMTGTYGIDLSINHW